MEECDELWRMEEEECVKNFVKFAKAHTEDDPRFPAALGDIKGDTDIDRRRYAIRTVFRAMKQPYDPLQGAWWGMVGTRNREKSRMRLKRVLETNSKNSKEEKEKRQERNGNTCWDT